MATEEETQTHEITQEQLDKRVELFISMIEDPSNNISWDDVRETHFKCLSQIAEKLDSAKRERDFRLFSEMKSLYVIIVAIPAIPMVGCFAIKPGMLFDINDHVDISSIPPGSPAYAIPAAYIAHKTAN